MWVFIGLAIFYLIGFNGLHRIGSDSSYYLALGQNIASGQGYTYHGAPDTVAMPLLPSLLSLCLKASPIHGVSIMLGLILAGGLATLALAYRLLCVYVSTTTAVLALLLFGTNHRIHEAHFRLLTDAPYLLGVLATLLGYAWLTRGNGDREDDPGLAPRRWATQGFAWSLFAAGLAVATTSRIVMLGLFMAVFAACAWHSIKSPRQLKHYFIAAISCAVLTAFYLLDPRQTPQGYTQSRTYEAGLWRYASDLGQTLHRSITQFLPDLLDPAATESIFGFDATLPVAVAFALLALTLGLVGCWKRPLWMIFFLANLGMMLVFSAIPRYFIPVALFIHLGIAVVVVRLAGQTGPKHWKASMTAVGLLCVTLIPNLIESTDLIIQQRRPGFYQHYKGGRYADLSGTAQALQTHVPPEAAVLIDNAEMLTYYAQRDVFSADELVKRRTHRQALDHLDQEYTQVYVLYPTSPAVEHLLDKPDVIVGPATATIPHWNSQTPPLSLHPVIFLSPESPGPP